MPNQIDIQFVDSQTGETRHINNAPLEQKTVSPEQFVKTFIKNVHPSVYEVVIKVPRLHFTLKTSPGWGCNISR